MAKTTVAQFELLSQQLTNRFKRTEDLLSQAWLEHELARDALRHLLTTYYQWLSEQGIEYEL
jgi:hypothetical protein